MATQPWDVSLPPLAKYDLSQGINTLAHFADLKNKEKDRKLQERKIVADEKSANALAIYKANEESRAAAKEAREVAKSKLEEFSRDMSYISALPDPEMKRVYYNDYVETRKAAGQVPTTGFLPADAFMTDGKWDDKKFNQYTRSVHYAVTATIDPKEGTMVEHVINNPKFDRTKPVGADNPQYIKVHATVRNGKLEPDLDLTTPTLDPFAVEERKERHTQAMEKIAAGQLEETRKKTGIAEKTAEKTGEKIVYDDAGNAMRYDPNKKVMVPVPGGKGAGKTAKGKDVNARLNELLGAGTSATPVASTAPTTPAQSIKVGDMYMGSKVRAVGKDPTSGAVIKVLIDDGTPQGKVVEYK